MAYVIYQRNKSGGAKNYQDTNTGEIISNRQYRFVSQAQSKGYSSYGQYLSKKDAISEKVHVLSKTKHTTYDLDIDGKISQQIAYQAAKHSFAYGMSVIVEGYVFKSFSNTTTGRKKESRQTPVFGINDVSALMDAIDEITDKYEIIITGMKLLIIEDA